MVLVRQQIGDVLRDLRLQKGKTLRQVASRASVALGYLSEVERGQKEASSEIIASLADALDVPVSTVMYNVADRLQVVESLQGYASLPQLNLEPRFSSQVPDTVPDDLMRDIDTRVLSH
ncbi:MAG: helix-turn-helix transcriptional regulator [Microbacteriaceae bacterium]